MYTDAPVAQKKLELDVSLQAAAQRRLKVLASKRKTAAKSADPHASLTAGRFQLRFVETQPVPSHHVGAFRNLMVSSP
jgi:hypothetical protein